MVHRGEQMRLFEVELVGPAFQKPNEMIHGPTLSKTGAADHRMLDCGVQSEASRQGLLHEVPSTEPGQCASRVRAGARSRACECPERRRVHMIALHVSQYGKQSAFARVDSRPDPVDEEPNL